jgi:ATP-dependent protease ClpP protease subunit
MPKWKLPRLRKSNEETTDEGELILPQDFKFEPFSSPTSICHNRIYFYGEVTKESILTLNKQLDETARNLRVFQVNYDVPVPPPIRLYIQSEGGDLIAALSTLGRIDELKNKGMEVHTIVEGIAASAATLISIGGSKRYIRRHATMLIHQLRSGFWGTYAEFQDETENVALLMKEMRNIYSHYTKCKGKILDGILKRDLYLSADECLKMGLADEIL